MSELLIIEKEKLVKVADEIRAKTGKADLMYVDDMPGEIGSISGIPEDSMEGLENGYDVMFYDENNYALAMYSIKEGHSINPPVYTCKNWQTDAGVSVSFPYTPSGDVIFYANNDTYASQLYAFYGLDSVVYPYLYIEYIKGNDTDTVKVVFTKSITNNMTLYQGTLCGYNSKVPKATRTIDEVVSVAMQQVASLPTKTNQMIYDQTDRDFYTNFDITLSMAKVYRLDQ